MFGWLRGRRSAAFDPVWAPVLRRNVWQYAHLDDTQREHTHTVVARMVAGKHWEGGAGYAVTDEHRVTVAGVAALLTLGAGRPFDFPHLRTIILYPEAFYAAPRNEEVSLLQDTYDPIFGEAPGGRLGEAWDDGPVILSWADVLETAREPGDGENLVLHEFAHHLDGLDGPIDGVPFIPNRDERHAWYEVTRVEYERLLEAAAGGRASLLDEYGATSPAEFFAVATECFFERPHELRREHHELYAALTRYYRHSPAQWLPNR
ncbi:MAG: M90 family metallopeptidase [Planctomycetota bacterium]